MSKTIQVAPRVIAAIVATGLLTFSGIIVETSMNIAFPTLMRDFNVPTDQVQWMTSAYLLVIAIIVPTSAYLKQSYPMKRLFVVANLLFSSGIFIDGLAINFSMLLVGRIVQGLGTGIALPLMFNIILEQVPKERLGLMMGIGNLIPGIGPALGPTFGGIVVTQLGWRAVFFSLVPVLVVSLGLEIWGIQQSSALEQTQLDWGSLLLIILLFVGFVTGFVNLTNNAFLSWQVGGMLLLGCLGLMGLFSHTFRIERPLLDLRLFKHRRFSCLILMFFLTQMCSLGLAFLLTNYIQLANHQSAFLAGVIVLPAGLGGALAAPIGGRLLDRKGPFLPIVSGESLMLLSLVGLLSLGAVKTSWAIGLVYIFYMAGMGMSMGCIMTTSLSGLDHQSQAQGNAILNTLQQFAGSMGTSLIAMIVAQAQLNHSSQLGTQIGTLHGYLLLIISSVIILGTGLVTLRKTN